MLIKSILIITDHDIQRKEDEIDQMQGKPLERSRSMAATELGDRSTSAQSPEDSKHLASDPEAQITGQNGPNLMGTNLPTNGMMDYNQMMQFMPNGMPNGMMGSFPNMMGKHYDYVILLLQADILLKACREWQWIL